MTLAILSSVLCFFISVMLWVLSIVITQEPRCEEVTKTIAFLGYALRYSLLDG